MPNQLPSGNFRLMLKTPNIKEVCLVRSACNSTSVYEQLNEKKKQCTFKCSWVIPCHNYRQTVTAYAKRFYGVTTVTRVKSSFTCW